MEIGTWTGDRALTIIKLAKRYHPAKEVEYYGFDLFGQMSTEIFAEEKSKWPPTQIEVYDKLSATGANIHLFQGDTMKVLPEVISKLPNMDFIFIDGGHSLETIASDWYWASQLMNSKTAVVFDDYWLGRTDAGSKVMVDSINRSKYSVAIWPLVDRFSKINSSTLNIKLACVRKK